MLRRTALNALAEGSLRQAIERLRVRRLVLASASPSTALTRTALRGLQEKYDVYVVWDACLERDTLELEIARLRLTWAGVIPTSIAAVMAELNPTLAPVDSF